MSHRTRRLKRLIKDEGIYSRSMCLYSSIFLQRVPLFHVNTTGAEWQRGDKRGTPALTQLSRQLVRAACSCLHEVIYLYLPLRKWYALDPRRTFFTTAELYIRAVTESFIGTGVIAPAPISLQLFPDSDVTCTHCMRDLKKRDSCVGTLVGSCPHPALSCPGSGRVNLRPPHPSSSGALFVPITGQ